jgi:hypothetical protein
MVIRPVGRETSCQACALGVASVAACAGANPIEASFRCLVRDVVVVDLDQAGLRGFGIRRGERKRRRVESLM